MRVILSLGSNLGERFLQLEKALCRIAKLMDTSLEKVSSAYETPAVLPPSAPQDWNLPYINIAALIRTQLGPIELLDALQVIEKSLGRMPAAHWAPRSIDIDIVLYGDKEITHKRLVIPHTHVLKREFVLTPCAEICPKSQIPGTNLNFLAAKRALTKQAPAWMQICNLSPDSFSGDGSSRSHESHTANMNYLDLGAESTRPGAEPISADEEWRRLEIALLSQKTEKLVRPKLSVDTRNPSTAERALESGAEVINDVSGLINEGMIELLSSSTCDVVLMHSLTVPADPMVTMAPEQDPVEELINWFDNRLQTLERSGIDTGRILVDPGIGFGKSADQSLEIIRRVDELKILDCRILIGHSRKSYLQPMTTLPPSSRDIETLAVSQHLAGLGVDVLRVHSGEDHQRFWKVRSHLA